MSKWTPHQIYEAQGKVAERAMILGDSLKYAAMLYLENEEFKAKAASVTELPHGELWIDNAGEAHFLCHTKGDDFAATKVAIQKFITVLQRQIDNEEHCPLFEPEANT